MPTSPWFFRLVVLAVSLGLPGVLLLAVPPGRPEPPQNLAPVITATPLPPLDPTPYGIPITIGVPLPTPALAPNAINPTNAAQLTETRTLGAPLYNSISNLVFTQDGAQLLSDWNQLTVWQWSPPISWTLLPTNVTHWSPLAVSPDGHIVAIGNYTATGKVELWNLATRQRDRYHQGGPQVVSLSFNVTGTMLAAAREGGLAHVWDVATGQLLWQFGGNGYCGGAAFHPLDNKIAVGALSSSGNALDVLDASTGQTLTSLTIPGGGCVENPTYSPNGQMLAGMQFWNKRVLLWQGSTYVGELAWPGGGTVWDIAWSPDGQLLAVVENSGPQGQQIVLWDVANRQIVTTLPRWRGVATFSPNGSQLVTERLTNLNSQPVVLTLKQRLFGPMIYR